jgi:hypothetical protein
MECESRKPQLPSLFLADTRGTPPPEDTLAVIGRVRGSA